MFPTTHHETFARYLHYFCCWLPGYRVHCTGPIERHHLISRGQCRGNEEARRVADALVVPVCKRHNESKLADQRSARALLLRRLSIWVDPAWLRAQLDGIPWKTPRPWLTYEGILSYLPRVSEAGPAVSPPCGRPTGSTPA